VYWNNKSQVRASMLFLFKVQLRTDDVEILRLIHRTLKVGRVEENLKNGTANPMARFVVNKIGELQSVIIPLFEQFPLRTRKARDFELFKRLVHLKAEFFHKRMPTEAWDLLQRDCRELRAVKRFNYGG